jgi:long-chain acyl-CoA synthetase
MSSPDLRWPLERAARLFGDAPAVTAAGRTVTYRELAARCTALAGALDGLGVERGERVAWLGENSLAHLEAWLGVPAAGRVLADLNFRLAVEELAFMIEDCGARVLVCDAGQLAVARELRERCAVLRTVVLEGEGDGGEEPGYEALLDAAGSAPGGSGAAGSAGGAASPAHSVDPDTLAAISYTGGTTGLPKGVMLSHGNLTANALHNLILTGHRSEDTFLHVCPMFHSAGVSNVFASTWAGARQVVLPRFDPVAVAETIERERVTLTTLVPTMLGRFVDHLRGEGAGADLSTLRNLHYAGSPITPALQRRAGETLHCELAEMYGMTECAPSVTHLVPDVHRRGLAGGEPHATRLASVGVPIAGVRAEVRSAAGEPLAPGEIGEVWVNGPNVMLGYWNRPEATAEALVDGWYRTGDAAYADSDGYLFIVDRLKDMVISGGENVYSVEVENVLAAADGVREAAVFGVPDERWGERVHAVVVVAEGADVTPESLQAFCRERIAGFKVPRSFELRAQPLPKSGAGKVLKTDLRAPYWREVGRGVS